MVINKKKLQYFAYGIIALAILSLVALQGWDNAIFFHTPEEILANPKSFRGRDIRIGGLVRPSSVTWNAKQVLLTFMITDNEQDVAVSFVGTKPDLFREGQGVVAEGRINQAGELQASRLLVKHSEEYQVDETWRADKKRLSQSLFDQ